MNIIDVKESLRNKSVYSLLTPSVFNPTPERLLSRAEKYQADDKVKVYAYSENGEHKGIIEVKINEQTAEILGIVVKPEYQGKGIGSRLINYIFSQFAVNKVTAETDDDAIGFYKKYGFADADINNKYDTKRYTYRSVFFILQNLYYLDSGKFIGTKKELREVLSGKDRLVLDTAISLAGGTEFDFDEAFDLLLTWCKETMIGI